MNLDRLVSLASTVHASPGTTALLIGSGVSKAAQIPTGWDVALDLIRRVATLSGEDPPLDPVAWYREHFKGDPDYSRLLETLAPTSAERRDLLSPYFEPTAEDLEAGVKVPTRSHRAIAELVSSGYVKVILTTNFDRLLEAALTQVGIDPVVVASAPAAAGAAPLAHTRCTVVKLHGDYLDPDLKNTVAELGTYDASVDSLLDRVLDEYGLVICGWSGEWDEALRNALLRAPSRRYSTWWAAKDPLGDRAGLLAAHRGAHVLDIQDADTFFEDLAGKVSTLAESMSPRPLSTALAVAELKRYLPDPRHRIRLHDLLIGEASRVAAAMASRPETAQPTGENVAAAHRHYEQLVGTLVPLAATTAYFADTPEQRSLLVEALRRLIAAPTHADGYVLWNNLQRYPATLLMYAIVIGAVAGRRGDVLGEVLALQAKMPFESEIKPVFVDASAWKSLDAEATNLFVVEKGTKHKTPSSEYLFRTLREPLRELVPGDAEFEHLFDETEYLLGVLFASWRGDGRGPIGRFAWRRMYSPPPADAAIRAHKDELVSAGIFPDAEAFEAAVSAYEARVNDSNISW